MNTKRNHILVGVIFVLLGAIALARGAVDMNYGALTLVGAGLALLLLYKTKRKSWSLAVGCYLLLFGGLHFAVTWLGLIPAFVPIIVAGVFFLAPGVIFLVLYYDKSKSGLLIPACILIWNGLYIFAFCIPGFSRVGFGMFFIFAGLAFVMMRVLGRHFLGNYLLYFGFVFIAAGVLALLGVPGSAGALPELPLLLPCAVILVGLLIILRAVFMRK